VALRDPARNDQGGFGMTTRLMKMSVLAEPTFATWTATPTELPASPRPASELAPAAGDREARGFRSVLRRALRSS
jgi:hypothetical protein